MKEMCNQFVCNHNETPCSKMKMNNMAHSMAGDMDTMGKMELTQAYVPMQPFTEPMDGEQSLVCGTAFADLVRPYCAGWNFYRSANLEV